MGDNIVIDVVNFGNSSITVPQLPTVVHDSVILVHLGLHSVIFDVHHNIHLPISHPQFLNKAQVEIVLNSSRYFGGFTARLQNWFQNYLCILSIWLP